MSEIVLNTVRKEFGDGVVAVNDISLEIESGEFVALVGPSGCGKTTTLRMVAGLEEVTAGQISINGRDVTHLPPRHRDIAMVFQNYALYAHMSARGNIGFGLKMAGMPKDEIARRVDAAAEILGITGLLRRKPKQLSGGERQRVAIGRAMVREPAAFLMDEPLSNLDAKLRVEMRAEIVDLQRRLGTPTLYVTHDQVEAMTMGDRVAVLRDGDLQQLGSPEELYENPVNVFVATFIGSPAMNLIPGRLHSDDGEPGLILGRSRLPLTAELLRRSPHLRERPAGDVLVGIRPEDFCAPEQAGSETHGVVDVTVVRAESLGSELIVYFEAPADSPAVRGDVEANATGEVADDTGPGGQAEETGPGGQAEDTGPGGEAVDVGSGEGAVDVGSGRSGSARRLLTARLDRGARLRDPGPGQLGVSLERLYFFDPQTGEAIEH